MNTIQKFKDSKIKRFSALLIFQFFILSIFSISLAQFTTDRDTLVILSGDSTSMTFTYDGSADTSGGTPYTGTAGYDLNGKILVGVDFDTTSAFTSAKFAIETSATYNDDADTSGGTPYDWKPVNYEGDLYTFTPEVGGINILKPQLIYALKRYIRFRCLTSASGYENEAAPRKLIPLIRSGF